MNKVFLTRLKTARGLLSQQAVADLLGIKQQSYARYESGKSTPGVDLLTRICEELNTSADYLLGLSEDPAPRSGGRTVVSAKGAAAVAINGNANNVHNNCQTCPLMQAAAKMTGKGKKN